MTTDSYDNNGNTLVSGGKGFIYDFQDKLIGMAGWPSLVSIIYDGDGNRVSKQVGAVTTKYLVDTNNPTWFPQVAEEIQNGTVTRRYAYGLTMLSQTQLIGGNWKTSFYGRDVHSGVRFLTDETGTLTDRYTYDAFGNLIAFDSTTPNLFLYAGEQYDFDLNLYYLRARYYNSMTGRFWTMDSWQGNQENPVSFHHYLYAANDPVNRTDPSGYDWTIQSLVFSQFYRSTIAAGTTISAAVAPRAAQISVAIQGGFRFMITRGQGAFEALFRNTSTRGVAAWQNAFLRTREVVAESEALASRNWGSYEGVGGMRESLNLIFSNGATRVNPANIQWHHLVGQLQQNATRFGNAINSVANVVPTPVTTHRIINGFYNAKPSWTNGLYVYDWMARQSWEYQYAAGLEIWRQAMTTGVITWHP